MLDYKSYARKWLGAICPPNGPVLCGQSLSTSPRHPQRISTRKASCHQQCRAGGRSTIGHRSSAFNLSYNEDDPAPRALSRLFFRLTPDLNGDGPPGYDQTGGGPIWNNILEFAIFQDFGGDEGGGDGELDLSTDGCIYEFFDDDNELQSVFLAGHPLITFDSQGFPYELTTNQAGDRSLNDAVYDLDFLFDSTAPGYQFPGSNPLDPDGNNNPTFPIDDWITAAPSPGNGYILAFRTSSSWANAQTLNAAINFAEMRPVAGNGDVFSADPGDNYPEFPDL